MEIGIDHFIFYVLIADLTETHILTGIIFVYTGMEIVKIKIRIIYGYQYLMFRYDKIFATYNSNMSIKSTPVLLVLGLVLR